MAAFAKPLLCAGRFISTEINLKMMYKEYRKTATVKAKLFEKGDENGFVLFEEMQKRGFECKILS